MKGPLTIWLSQGLTKILPQDGHKIDDDGAGSLMAMPIDDDYLHWMMLLASVHRSTMINQSSNKGRTWDSITRGPMMGS